MVTVRDIDYIETVAKLSRQFRGKSVKECSQSISIQNGGSDVRFERRHVFWLDRFVQRPLGDVAVLI